jgi:hypothetical protein
MKNKDFDKLFQDGLSNHQSGSQTPDWDVFSEILKKSEGFENVDFDQTIKEKVARHQSPYNDGHWQLLKSRLEKEESLRKKIFSIKSLELIALLMLFLGWQTYQSSLHKIPVNYAMTSPAAPTSGKHPMAAEAATVDASVLAFSHLAYQVKAAEVVASLTPKTSAILTSNTQAAPFLATAVYHPSFATTSRLPAKMTAPHTLATIAEMPSVAWGLSPIHVNAAAGKKYIMPIVSAGVGITQSGFDPIYNLKSYSTYSSQFAGGLMLGYQNDELETTTGLKYTRRTHTPAAIVETYGDFLNNYYEISLDKIGYDIVEIPVAAKYHFKKGGKTSWYAKAGVSANLTLANHYTITNKPAGLQPLAPSNVGYVSESDIKTTSARLSEKAFNPGLLQGGKLAENWFLTVSGEVGMERKLNENHALVLGAEYSKFYWIDGIGPNKDKLNGFAINLGIKKYLN